MGDVNTVPGAFFVTDGGCLDDSLTSSTLQEDLDAKGTANTQLGPSDHMPFVTGTHHILIQIQTVYR